MTISHFDLTNQHKKKFQRHLTFSQSRTIQEHTSMTNTNMSDASTSPNSCTPTAVASLSTHPAFLSLFSQSDNFFPLRPWTGEQQNENVLRNTSSYSSSKESILAILGEALEIFNDDDFDQGLLPEEEPSCCAFESPNKRSDPQQ
jgi:hypothetical protein